MKTLALLIFTITIMVATTAAAVEVKEAPLPLKILTNPISIYISGPDGMIRDTTMVTVEKKLYRQTVVPTDVDYYVYNASGKVRKGILVICQFSTVQVSGTIEELESGYREELTDIEWGDPAEIQKSTLAAPALQQKLKLSTTWATIKTR